MRIIIAGSRSCRPRPEVISAHLKRLGWKPTLIVSGRAMGADLAGEAWAKKNNVPLALYPADWKNSGKQAGVLRNIEMASRADAALIFWDGKSPGSAHMIRAAMARDLPMAVIRPEQKL